MPVLFDPYREWLGIPPEEQPPNHYRLLGFPKFQADPAKVNEAADKLMKHVRTFQLGPRSSDSQKVLNDLSAARVTLMDAKRRAAYDVVLRAAKAADLATEAAANEPKAKAAPAFDRRAVPTIGPYEILERLVAQPLGVTYKARDPASGRYYSLKTLPAEAARKPEVVKRFRREIEIVTKLDHPNLIGGVDQGEHHGAPYLVTEFILGADLGTLVQQQGPLPVDLAVDYVVQAARALGQLHMNGVFHRNIKPQVLLVDMMGRVKITNLLLAKIAESSTLDAGENLTRMGEMMGTVDYLAPEQAAAASAVDGRADIYALGCTLHFLLTGRPPYVSKSTMEKLLAHQRSPIPSLRAARADVPAEVDRVFQRMLAKDPNMRFGSAAALVQELSSDAVSSSTAGGGEATPLWLYGAIGGGIAAVVVVLGLIVFNLLR